MAYNNLSGTIIQPSAMVPGRVTATGELVVPIISGNLSTSDGGDLVNIPRVSNATDNAILTNVAGDANSLTCESNLTFDGSTLSVTGDSSFIGTVDISGSGGLTITGSITPSGSNAFSLGSVSNRWKELFVGTGSIHIGTNGATIASNESEDVITFNKTISSSLNMSASAFYGYGGNLTGLVESQGPIGALQFNTGSGFLGGSSDLSFSSNVLQVNGGLRLRRTHTSASLTASVSDYYIGVNSSLAPVNIQLPSAGALSDGQTYVVKDEGGASHTNSITILASGSQEIDGQNSIILQSPYASIQLYSNGADKFFVF